MIYGWDSPLVMTKIALEHGLVEIVEKKPLKMVENGGSFRCVNVYQRVSSQVRRADFCSDVPGRWGLSSTKDHPPWQCWVSLGEKNGGQIHHFQLKWVHHGTSTIYSDGILLGLNLYIF